jgi:multiple sugar transport system substrate-binding protein
MEPSGEGGRGARRPGVSRRGALAAGAAAGTAGVLAACGGGDQAPSGREAAPAPSATPVTVRVVTDFSNPVQVDTTKEAFAVFESENPAIKVEITHGLGGAYVPKLTGMIAGGDAPDVMRFIVEWFREFAARGDFQPIDAYLSRDKEVVDDQIPALLQLSDYKGKRYALPWGFNAVLLWYNRAAFEQAGVPLPGGTMTLEGFADASRRLTRDVGGAKHWGFAPPDMANTWATGGWLYSNGGAWLNESWTASELDKAGAHGALQFLADLIHKQKVTPTPAELTEAGGINTAFANGRVAMIQGGRSLLGQITRAGGKDFDVTFLPRGAGGASVTSVGGGMFPMSSASKLKDQAYRVQRFLTSPVMQDLLAQREVTTPVSKRVLTGPTVVRPDHPPRNARIFFESLANARIVESPTGGIRVAEVYREQLTPVQAGERAARDAAGAIKPLVDAILKETER